MGTAAPLTAPGPKARALLLALGWAAILAGVALRVLFPDVRPVHVDEAVQAAKTGDILGSGVFVLDARDHHGPTLHFAGAALARVLGQGSFAELEIGTLRAIPIAAGLLLVLLVASARAPDRTPAAWLAAGAVALSPSLVYYSRYYIQEMLLAALTAAFACAAWGLFRRPSAIRALGVALIAGLMLATKPTAVLVLGTFALAALALPEGRGALRRHAVLVLAAAACAVAVAAFVNSSFLREPSGAWEAWRAVFVGAGRGIEGDGHAQPWWHLAALLAWHREPPWVWSEHLLVASGLAGGVLAWINREPGRAFERWVGLATLLLAAAYAALPYKTPWLAIGVLPGLGLCAPVAFATLARRQAALVLVVGTAGLLHLGFQAHRASFVVPAGPRNPWAYMHTLRDAERLAARIEERAAAAPGPFPVRVLLEEPWPLPWYLRRLDDVAYLSPDAALPDAEAWIIEPRRAPEFDGRSVAFHGLRPGNACVLVFAEE